MRVTSVAAIALVLAATPTAVAAAPKPLAPYCVGLTDATGDAVFLGPVTPGQSLDVLSADSALGRTEVVVVLRVPTTDTSNDALRRAGGYEWVVRLTADGVSHTYSYRVNAETAGNTRTARAVLGEMTPPVTVQVTPTHIIWRVKRSDVPPRPDGPRSAAVEMDVTSKAWGNPADTAYARVPRSSCS